MLADVRNGKLELKKLKKSRYHTVCCTLLTHLSLSLSLAIDCVSHVSVPLHQIQ